MENRLNKICSQFQLEGTILSVKPLGEGFINDTLLITTAEATTPNYILQRKNKNIFQNVPAMMDNIYRVTTHLKKKITANFGLYAYSSATPLLTRKPILPHWPTREERESENSRRCFQISKNL